LHDNAAFFPSLGELGFLSNKRSQLISQTDWGNQQLFVRLLSGIACKVVEQIGSIGA